MQDVLLMRDKRLANKPETAKTTLAQATYDNDAKKLWNRAPLVIKHSKSLNIAKKSIKNYVKNLPN